MTTEDMDKKWRKDLHPEPVGVTSQDYEQFELGPQDDMEGHSRPAVTDNGDLLVRVFDTGATRDTDEGKYDYEGFLSPEVLQCFAGYMHRNRIQSDGSARDGDNWQNGIPKSVYMKSGFRHFMDWWLVHRNPQHPDEYVQEALCALLFNVMGYLHEHLKGKEDD